MSAVLRRLRWVITGLNKATPKRLNNTDVRPSPLSLSQQPQLQVPDSISSKYKRKKVARPMLEAVHEVAVYIHRFHNLDLFQQGYVLLLTLTIFSFGTLTTISYYCYEFFHYFYGMYSGGIKSKSQWDGRIVRTVHWQHHQELFSMKVGLQLYNVIIYLHQWKFTCLYWMNWVPDSLISLVMMHVIYQSVLFLAAVMLIFFLLWIEMAKLKRNRR